jgi:hypothetical protein
MKMVKEKETLRTMFDEKLFSESMRRSHRIASKAVVFPGYPFEVRVIFIR